MSQPDPSPEDVRPFVVPCATLDAGAPLRWLRAGWRDFRAAPGLSLTFGLVIVLVSAGISLLAWTLGKFALLATLLSGFVFVAPLICVGLYCVSRALERGRRPMLADRDVDMITAAVSSVNAVLRNKAVMMWWAAIIITMTAIGFATALLGLAILMPWLAYAAWHGYRETFDASRWPSLD